MRYNIYADNKPVDMAIDYDVAKHKYHQYVKDMRAGYSKRVVMTIQKDTYSKEEVIENEEV